MKKSILFVVWVVVCSLGSVQAGDYDINEFTVYTGSGGQSHPMIDGDTVVWIDADFGNGPSGPVHYKNLSTGPASVITTSWTNTWWGWSPAIDGRSLGFMECKHYTEGVPVEVVNVEGMAMALSGELIRKVQKLVDGSPLGFGQDLWLSYRARKAKLRNIIDGSVCLHHPPEIGYDLEEANRQMQDTFGALFGPGFDRRGRDSVGDSKQHQNQHQRTGRARGPAPTGPSIVVRSALGR